MPARGPVGQVARDFDLTETAVREWVKQAGLDAGTQRAGMSRRSGPGRTPSYLQRLDDVPPPKTTGLQGTITEIYRRHVWVTPSGVGGLPHFEFIHKVIGADRIIWSVDYPVPHAGRHP